jgi:hypothetical protein
VRCCRPRRSGSLLRIEIAAIRNYGTGCSTTLASNASRGRMMVRGPRVRILLPPAASPMRSSIDFAQRAIPYSTRPTGLVGCYDAVRSLQPACESARTILGWGTGAWTCRGTGSSNPSPSTSESGASPGSGKWRLLVPDCRILERVMACTELRRRLFHRSHEPTNSALFCSPQASYMTCRSYR